MKISSAAVLYQGNVITGKNHNEIIRRISYSSSYEEPVTSAMQGFVTDGGDFVNRIRAGRIALESKQISELAHPPFLYSEDLISE